MRCGEKQFALATTIINATGFDPVQKCLTADGTEDMHHEGELGRALVVGNVTGRGALRFLAEKNNNGLNNNLLLF